ncbi:hypothetical protein [Devosia submarina]|uniref:DUF7946 domain-containing protein n=1 Tax=Devosia submarina TaxID=1173082 RepID=UPI000D35F9CB|nr:hypothetical protein [Devosia submarina]
MAVERFDGILIKYEGLDADHALVDMGQLGASIQGASRLIAAGGHIALTSKFNKEDFGKSIRIMTRPPQAGSYEMWALLLPVLPLATPFLPVLDTVFKTAATKVTEAAVNAALATWAGRKSEAQENRELLLEAMKEMGHTTRTAMEAFERMTNSLHASGRQFVAPIGSSAATVQIGREENGAFPINAVDREVIDRKSGTRIAEESTFTVLITELDLVTHNCKVEVLDSEGVSGRIAGTITDPQVELPKNPYSSAFDAQTPIRVRAKPRLVDDQVEKLFISDVAA